MKLSAAFKMITLFLVSLGLTSCLKTRSDVGEDEQSQVYSKKSADNQKAAVADSQLNQKTAVVPEVDERDEVIRTLNGRVENLENQITSLNKEKTTLGSIHISPTAIAAIVYHAAR